MKTTHFYIDGSWVEPVEPRIHPVINPATEEPCAEISLGSARDVDLAVEAARSAFPAWSESSKEERIALLERAISIYQKRMGEMADVISREMGATLALAQRAQAPAGLAQFVATLNALRNFAFEKDMGTTRLRHEAVGVCALITPWNWPINQVAAKVAPALAAGCTMVLKPSEMAPLDSHLLAEILHEAGVPKGVFNLVQGDGLSVGIPLSSHPQVDMVSFTGSTRAGIEISRNAASTVKRVALELGGKSPNIILEDADLRKAVTEGVAAMFTNVGQSCNAPSRMLVPKRLHDEAAQIARGLAETHKVGDPTAAETTLGPVANRKQFGKIQELIGKGIEEGATLVAGGMGRPDGLNQGYYVRPTVFADVHNDMTIAREEIFGPVLSILPYEDESDAVRIANDTPYGLSAYVQSGDVDRARAVGKKIRAGNVHLNGASVDFGAPFGGYKQSGNGREWGVFGLKEYLEIKALLGSNPA